MRAPLYTAGARRDLRHIARYIAHESGSQCVASHFIDSIYAQCARLAGLPGTLGQDRRELLEGLRSTPHRNYTIFFRYCGERFEVVRVISAKRDIPAMFGSDEA